jgi:GNAT superfamily N-acetyltransferase
MSLVNLKFRTATSGDEPFLREMLYLALFVPPGAPPIPRSLLKDPALARYVQHWGTRPGDSGPIALVDDSSVGAAWLRQFPVTDPGYGFADESTRELSIALLPAWRGKGIGSQLLKSLLNDAPGRIPELRPGKPRLPPLSPLRIPAAGEQLDAAPLGLVVLRCCS